MRETIHDSFDKLVVPILAELAEEYKIDGYHVKLDKIGPFTPLGTRWSRENSKRCPDPPYRSSISVAADVRAAIISVFSYGVNDQIQIGVINPYGPLKSHLQLNFKQVKEELAGTINRLIHENL